MFHIVRAADAPPDFSRWRDQPVFAEQKAHPFFGGFGRGYYPLVFGAGRDDASFVVLRNERPVLLVLCAAGSDSVDHYGQPIHLFGEAEGAQESVRVAFEELTRVAANRRKLLIAGTWPKSAFPDIANVCAAYGLASSPRFTAFIDLKEGEAGLRKHLRKSFRSLVNWGRANLRIVYINAQNPDKGAFAEYEEFHHRVAGRSTRPQSTWDAMFDWIATGAGELVLGYLADGAMVAGTMIVDGVETAYYASGVYDRERFDKPLAHWPLYDAILRTHARGPRWFDLGDIPVEGTVSPKEYNIGYFKRGFAQEIVESAIWSGVPRPPS